MMIMIVNMMMMMTSICLSLEEGTGNDDDVKDNRGDDEDDYGDSHEG